MNKELEKALYTAGERCKGNIIIDEAGLNGFEEIYPFTTENIAGYIDYFDLKDKSLLTVGSSGDQVFNAALKDVKTVTLLDINPYTKYYYYLKEASILELSMSEFEQFYQYKSYNDYSIINPNVFNKTSYNKLKSTLQLLDYDSYLFWDELFAKYPPMVVRYHLFNKDDSYQTLKNCSLYLQSENAFDEEKEKIKKFRPEFITGTVTEASVDKSFDNIWLSNIFCSLLPYERKLVTDKFSRSLNADGKFLISYLYEKCMGTRHVIEASLELLNEYSPSVYSFGGVEQMKGKTNGSEDAILVYQKKIR